MRQIGGMIKLFVVMIEKEIEETYEVIVVSEAPYTGTWHETRSEAEKELKKARLDPDILASWIEER